MMHMPSAVYRRSVIMATLLIGDLFMCQMLTNPECNAFTTNEHRINICHMCLKETVSAHLECKCMAACKSHAFRD